MALAAGLIALAFRSQGYAATDIDLSDSSVWVTNDNQGTVGRLNRQVNELNSTLRANKPFDVLQYGDTVLVSDAVKDEVRPVDVASVALSGRIGVPDKAALSLGGGVLAIADPATGAVWAGTPGALSGLDPANAQPLFTAAPDAVVAVSTGGTVFAAAPGTGSLWSTRINTDDPAAATIGADGGPQTLEPATLAGAELTPTDALLGSQVSITAVGETPVLLDLGSREVIFADHRVVLPGSGRVALQQPGADAPGVLVATETGLLRIPLSDGEPVQEVAGGVNGAPAAPVQLGGCAHGAWSDDEPSYAVSCDGAAATVLPIPGVTAESALVFRVNRQVIVLNDQSSGNVWLVDDDMTMVNNWDEVAPQEGQDDTSNEGDQGTSAQPTTSRTDCATTTAAVEPPLPEDDTVGVRPGRGTVLRVLDNDSVPDCSAVAISAVTPLPAELGSVSVVDQGRALQIDVAATATGALPPIDYTVDDGLGHQATASLIATVTPSSVTTAPAQVRDSAGVIEAGGALQYNVLSDFTSPVGDDLSLVSASADTGDPVAFQPDGLVTFRDTGAAGLGKRVVDLTVSDGTTQIAGRLLVEVKAAGSAAPVASPVLAAARTGRPVTVYPLRSVQSGSAEPLRLGGVTLKSGAGASATPAPDGSVVLQASTPGTYYFSYQVTAGEGSASGALRFDVTDPPAAPVPPAPMLDVVYLPAGETVTIDPLHNDADPMGAGLAVAGITRAEAPTLSLAERAMQTLQVAARGALRQTSSFRYDVSNGVGASTGEVRVVPVAALESPPSPTAAPVSVVVRAGDAVTIPIARYASDPQGSELTVVLDDREVAAVPGSLFASGDDIRYLAPVTPPGSPVTFAYTVINTQGRSSPAATVTIAVTPADPAVNGPPVAPAPVVARVLAGGRVDIPLPLDGLDPDGDWVTLSAIAEPGTLGAAKPAAVAAIGYDALDAPGVDRIEYTAADPSGANVNGVVTVIVVAPPELLQPPVAPDLIAAVRPGKVIAIDALASVQGQGVRYDSTPFVSAENWPVSVDGTNLILQAPSEPTVGTIAYNVVDERGLTAAGIITVSVSATAALKAPSAEDVFVDPSMISPDKLTATVDVGNRVRNYSGAAADLVVGVPDGSPATLADDRVISVPLLPIRQVLTYWVRDVDGLLGRAFIVVPPATAVLEAQLQVKGRVAPLRVTAGQTVDGAIADFVAVAAGREATIPADARFSANQGVGSRVDSATVRFAADVGSGGNDVLRVPVSDGTDEPVEVDVPVVITPVVDMPTLRSGAVDVEAGGTQSISLLPYLDPPTYPGAGSLTFTASPGGSGIGAEIDGSTLTVTADAGVALGSTTPVTVQAANGTGGIANSVFAVTVTGSTQPLPTVGAFTADGVAGAPTQVDVLTGSVDPVGQGLTVLPEVDVERGDGTAVVTGSIMTVTPAAGQVGDVVVLFTVADGTGDVDRQVSGRVTVTVKDRPSAPGTPVEVAGTLTNTAVTLQWAAAAPNGSPVSRYVLSGNGFSQDCAGTTCRIEGLTTGRTYAFSVVAVNEVGTSDPSPPSADIIVDAVPQDPSPPTVNYVGPGHLRVNWTIPTGPFSAVTGVEVKRFENGVDTGAVESVGLSSSKDLTGLTAGTAYSFAIRVTNSQGASNWSQPGNSENPSDVPGPPSNVQAVAQYPDPWSHDLLVTWESPEAHGEDIERYLVVINGTIAAEVTETTYTALDINSGSYQVTVRAINGRGEGAPSANVSLNVSTSGWPLADLQASANRPDSSIDLSWRGYPEGSPPSTFQYSLDGGATWIGWFYKSATIPNLTPGTSYSVLLRECAPQAVSAGLPNACGQPAESNSVVPYSDTVAPDVRLIGTGQDYIDVAWDVPQDNGRGPMSWQISWGPTGNTTPFAPYSDTQFRISGECGTLYYFLIKVLDSGVNSNAGANSGVHQFSTEACPVQQQVMTIAQASPGAGIDLSVSGFAEGSYSVQCWVTPDSTGQGGSAVGSFGISVGSAGSGSWSPPSTCAMAGAYGNLRIGPNDIWSNTIALQ